MRAADRNHGFVDGSAYCSFAQLLERCQPGMSRPCSPLTSRIVLWSCAQHLAPGPFGSFVNEPAFARSGLELMFELKKGMVSPRALAETAESFPESRRDYARYLARLFGRYEQRLKLLRLADPEDRLLAAFEALKSKGLPRSLQGLREIQIGAIYDWPPLRSEFLLALAQACERSGTILRVSLPASGSGPVDLAVDRALALVEKRGESLRSLEIMKWDAIAERRPLAFLGATLFSSEPSSGAAAQALGPHLKLLSASGRREEVRVLARLVRERLEKGCAVEQIAVAFPELREEAEWAVEALEELGIPARIRRGAPLSSTGAGRTALSLAGILEDGFPAHEVARLLASRYLPELVGPRSPGALLRLAGVRDNNVGATEGRGAYQVRLSALAARLEERSPQQSAEVRELMERCGLLIRTLEQCPQVSSATAMLEHWSRSLEGLGFHRVFRRPEPRGPEDTGFGRAILRAIAADQLAVEALGQLVLALKEALGLAATESSPWTRGVFRSWLEDAAADFNLAPKSARGGAVEVLDLRELVGRSFKHLLMGGLVEGRFPAAMTDSAVFSLEDRLSLNRALGREALPSSTSDGDNRIDQRVAEARLLFYLGLTAAEQEVVLSYARTGSRGQLQLPSPFFEEVERLTGVRREAVPLRPAPTIREVWNEQQLRERVAIEALIPLELRLEQPDASARRLARVFEDEAWWHEAEELAEIERQRLRFFSDPNAPPGPFCGGISAADVHAALQAEFCGGLNRPISASALGRLGNCLFQGFLRNVLRVEGPSTASEDMDAKDRGSYWHKFLEILIPLLRREGMLDRRLSDIPPRLVEQALDTASELQQKSAHVGHPALWRLSRERAQAMARRLFDNSHRGLPFEGHWPSDTELRFGSSEAVESWRQIRIPGCFDEADVFVEGKIDRLDQGDRSVGVIDYKSGAAPSGRKAIDKLLTTEFQLPLYLYAARLATQQPVDAAWLSLKDGTTVLLSSLLDAYEAQSVEDLLASDCNRRARLEKAGKKNLANAVHALIHKVRNGEFSIRPLDCAYCEYASVCRITERRLSEVGNG